MWPIECLLASRLTTLASQGRSVEPLQEPARNVASHGNSNTEEVGVGLNGNLISGRRTLIYTGEATLKPNAVNPYEPNGHSDSNTQGAARGVVVRLNQNVIKGETTSLCTRDASIRHIVDRANDLWNNALRTQSWVRCL